MAALWKKVKSSAKAIHSAGILLHSSGLIELKRYRVSILGCKFTSFKPCLVWFLFFNFIRSQTEKKRNRKLIGQAEWEKEKIGAWRNSNLGIDLNWIRSSREEWMKPAAPSNQKERLIWFIEWINWRNWMSLISEINEWNAAISLSFLACGLSSDWCRNLNAAPNSLTLSATNLLFRFSLLSLSSLFLHLISVNQIERKKSERREREDWIKLIMRLEWFRHF